MIYASRLRFCEPFFQCGLLCLFFCCIFLNLMLSMLHELLDTSTVSIVDKIDPTIEDVEMVKKNTLSITLGCIFL